MNVNPAPTVTLQNGVEMPQLGLGTWPMNNHEAEITVEAALNMGYRLIDTAENYENEQGVGEAIRKSSVPREEVFVTTKFNRKWHSREGARIACKASLKRMGLDYIDLLLIHWPNPDLNQYLDAYEGLLRLLESGLVRAIGTSNFKIEHLQRLFGSGYFPHVNQIQLDPYHLRNDLIDIHKLKGIITETWSPLGRANLMLADPVILKIAENHQCTTAQVVLRWHTQLGYVPTPKSSQLERMAQNIDIFNINLSEVEIDLLNGLDRPDPHMFDADVFGH